MLQHQKPYTYNQSTAAVLLLGVLSAEHLNYGIACTLYYSIQPLYLPFLDTEKKYYLLLGKFHLT